MLFVFSSLLLLNGVIVTSWTTSQNNLVNNMLKSYDKKVKPTKNANHPVNVSFSMELYQIIEVNEPHQFVLMNTWIVERWRDELLYWHPKHHDNISEIMLPHNVIWLPDTTLYNTLIMKSEDERRLMNVKLTTNTRDESVSIELLYPTIYKFSCQINIYYFPFDSQFCIMTFGSWTYDKKGIDYFPYSDHVGTSSFLDNELWSVEGFQAIRHEHKYACCPNNYTNLYYNLHIKRRPLFYIVNLIIPTCIITFIAIVGFFTPSSTIGERNEKITLGMTTLLSMSILLLMVSDQMPTTSTFIPLIGWFYLSMIVLISMSTITATVVISVQKMGYQRDQLPPHVVRIARKFSRLSFTRIPPHLQIEELVKAPSKRSYKRHSTLVHSESESQLLLPPAHIILCSKSPDSAETVKFWRRTSSQRVNRTFKSRKNEVGNCLFVMSGNDGKSVKIEYEEGRKTTFKSCVTRQRKLTAEPSIERKTSRVLVSREYEWLATVIERCSLFFFLLLLLAFALGINAIGLVQWM